MNPSPISPLLWGMPMFTTFHARSKKSVYPPRNTQNYIKQTHNKTYLQCKQIAILIAHLAVFEIFCLFFRQLWRSDSNTRMTESESVVHTLSISKTLHTPYLFTITYICSNQSHNNFSSNSYLSVSILYHIPIKITIILLFLLFEIWYPLLII